MFFCISKKNQYNKKKPLLWFVLKHFIFKTLQMALDNLEQQQSGDIISTQETQDLLTQLETKNPELSQFAKKIQQNIKQKNFPDQNSELVASISVLSKIKDKSQLQLAQQIMLKTQIKPSLFASETNK